jgi:Ion channel
MEYQDQETFMPVRDHKLIGRRYIYSGWFFIDFAATFPINYVTGSNVLWVRLLRLFRLPKLIKILDLSRFNRLLRSLFEYVYDRLEGSTRQDRIVAQHVLMYSYKIFRLIIIAVIIIYFAGCMWYLISANVNNTRDDLANSFITTYFTDRNITSNSDRLVIACYFAVSTLTTAGYGDYFPQTQNEMIFCFIIMLMGVAFFSYIMSAFIEIISNYDKKMGDDAANREAALHNWLTLVTRFQGSDGRGGGAGTKPLPKYLSS